MPLCSPCKGNKYAKILHIGSSDQARLPCSGAPLCDCSSSVPGATLQFEVTCPDLHIIESELFILAGVMQAPCRVTGSLHLQSSQPSRAYWLSQDPRCIVKQQRASTLPVCTQTPQKKMKFLCCPTCLVIFMLFLLFWVF